LSLWQNGNYYGDEKGNETEICREMSDVPSGLIGSQKVGWAKKLEMEHFHT